MRNVNDCLPFIEHLQQEHQRLAQLLKQTQAALSGWVNSQNEGHRFVQMLVHLRDELDRHYTEEERGGCLEEVECRCPSLAGEVKRIEAEHGQLRQEMEQLVARASSLANSPAGLGELEKSLQEFITRVRRHEAAENRMMVYGFGADALDEFTDEPSHVDAGPCACGNRPPDVAHPVNLQE